LAKMLAAFSQAADEMRIAPLLMHGALLGWHWNKQLLPSDQDIDMCVTIEDLRRANRYGGTFLRAGETYLWDVNPNNTSRATMNASTRDSPCPSPDYGRGENPSARRCGRHSRRWIRATTSACVHTRSVGSTR
jgi:hypothetical protein